MHDVYRVWTDGGCRPNPGCGGWGALIRNDHGDMELYGGELDTTNNRMEMSAAIRALEYLPIGAEVILYTDSQYLRNGITKWVKNWIRRDWQTADGRPVSNVDLWRRLDHAVSQRHVSWHWVKGHAGHRENEQVDQLATLGLQETQGRRR